MSKEKLKQCPFCVGKARILYSILSKEPIGIECKKCGYHLIWYKKGINITNIGKTPNLKLRQNWYEILLKRWNNRIDKPKP